MLHARAENILRGIATTLTPNGFKQLKTTIAHQREASQREYDHTSLSHYTQKRLLSLVRHAINTVPFYQKAWNEVGITESALQTQEEIFQNLPLIDKTLLQKQGHKQLLSNISKPTTLSKSSGTTGEPTFRFKDHGAVVFNHFAVRRYLRDNHIQTGSTILFSHSDKSKPIFQQYVPLQFFTKRVFASVFTLIESPRLASNLHIDVVVGSPHQLQLLAENVFSRNDVKPPLLFVSIAERLDVHQRKAIESYTGSTVIDVYCGSEFSTLIAFECKLCHKLHTNSDFIFVEIVDSDSRPLPKGHMGEVVITDLCNYVSPLIRYRTGDLATVSETTLCDCKRALPIQLGKIEGRITDQITVVGGNKISALPLLNRLRALLNTDFTLVQEDLDFFILQLNEPDKKDFKVAFSVIQEAFFQHLNLNASIKLCFGNLLDQMGKSPSKVTPFLSKIPRHENLVL